LNIKPDKPAEIPLRRVLLADDEPLVWRIVERLLGPQWILETVSDSLQAVEMLHRQRFQVVVADYDMPGHDGIWLLKKVKQIDPQAVRILLSGHSIEAINTYLSSGLVNHFISKPIDQDRLSRALDSTRDIGSP